MESTIVVILKRYDNVDELVPLLDKLARPGMKVVFLAPYPVDPWLYLGDHWITSAFVTKTISDGNDLAAQYSWDLQKGLVEGRISCARRALERRGVEVVVEICPAPLKKARREYAHDASVKVYMTSNRVSLRRKATLKELVTTGKAKGLYIGSTPVMDSKPNG